MSGLSGEDRGRLERLLRTLENEEGVAGTREIANRLGNQASALTRALALIDQQEKALGAADELATVAALVDSQARRLAARDAYRSARATSTKEEQNNGD